MAPTVEQKPSNKYQRSSIRDLGSGLVSQVPSLSDAIGVVGDTNIKLKKNGAMMLLVGAYHRASIPRFIEWHCLVKE